MYKTDMIYLGFHQKVVYEGQQYRIHQASVTLDGVYYDLCGKDCFEGSRRVPGLLKNVPLNKLAALPTVHGIWFSYLPFMLLQSREFSSEIVDAVFPTINDTSYRPDWCTIFTAHGHTDGDFKWALETGRNAYGREANAVLERLLNWGDGTEAGSYWNLVRVTNPTADMQTAWFVSRAAQIAERNEKAKALV